MHHIGMIIVVAALTYFALGILRRIAFRRHRWGYWHHGGGWHGHGHGRGFFLGRALSWFNASDEQRKQIEEKEGLLREDFLALRQGYRQLMLELGEMLPSEHLDEGALDHLVDSLMDLAGKLRVDLRQTLVEVHEKATPEQRKRLATMLRHRFS
jgi:Spy/CpxP family protein refolding chaperone